jgi:hypothetical protein
MALTQVTVVGTDRALVAAWSAEFAAYSTVRGEVLAPPEDLEAKLSWLS